MQICGGGWNVMAIFKVIEEQYVCENEVGNLVNYILKKCRSFFTINLYDINNSLYSNQILYFLALSVFCQEENAVKSIAFFHGFFIQNHENGSFGRSFAAK